MCSSDLSFRGYLHSPLCDITAHRCKYPRKLHRIYYFQRCRILHSCTIDDCKFDEMLCLGLLWLRDESFLQANPRFSAMFATSLLLRPAPEVKIKALVHHCRYTCFNQRARVSLYCNTYALLVGGCLFFYSLLQCRQHICASRIAHVL